MRSYSRLWTHVIFSTKYREPTLLKDYDWKIHQHIHQQLAIQECIPIVVNGVEDHVHLLYCSNYKKAPADIIRDVKGETSYWANRQGFLQYKLCWQDGFANFSVGHADLDRVTHYILNQKAHHLKQKLDKELMDLANNENEKIEKLTSIVNNKLYLCL
jgi:REP element-mobilizing transposase RayT